MKNRIFFMILTICAAAVICMVAMFTPRVVETSSGWGILWWLTCNILALTGIFGLIGEALNKMIHDMMEDRYLPMFRAQGQRIEGIWTLITDIEADLRDKFDIRKERVKSPEDSNTQKAIGSHGKGRNIGRKKFRE